MLIALAFTLSVSPLRAEDAAKPPGGEIHELAQITAELPHDVLLGYMNAAGKQAAATKGTEELRKKVEGRMATLKFKIDKVETDDRHGQAEPYRLKAEDLHVRQGAVNFKVYLWVHFNISENAKIAAMKKGDEVTASGKVTLAKLSAPNAGPAMNVDLSEAVVK